MLRWMLAAPVVLMVALGAWVGPPPVQDPPQGEATGAQKPAQVDPGEQTALAELLEHLEKGGVRLDVERGVITIDAEVLVTDDYLEYFLIGRRGKAHESLFRTEVVASTLKSAFMALGFQDGKNVQYRDMDPMPTLEEVRQGAPAVEVLRPEGPLLHVTVEWKDEEGRPVRHPGENLWIDVRHEKPPKDVRWVWFGGRMAPLYRGEPPVFVADVAQNLISLCYMKPDNHLMTACHEHATNDKLWWANLKLVPERGTPVRIHFSKEPLAEKEKEKEAEGGAKGG